MEHTGIRHEQWDFVPFDAGVETADGPLPKDEEKAVSEKLLPTIEYACITEEQQALIDQLRAELGDLVPKPRQDHHMHTDFYLARYLVARDWDVKKAKHMFVAAMQWRLENDTDNMLENFEKSEYYDLIMNYWPCSVHKDWDFWTYDNAWIVYQRLAQMDPKMVDRVPLEAVMDYHKYVVELVEKKHAKIVHQKGYSPGGVVIEDLSGLGYHHMHKKALDIVAMIAHIDDNYYPAILRKFYLLNAPYVFTVFWNIIKKFLNERTASKFEVLGSNREENEAMLKEIIPEKYIPKYLGGSSEFPMPVGGPSENVKLAIPVNHRSVTVSAGKTYKHPLEVKKPSTIFWEFSVKHHDIKFSVVKHVEDGNNVEVVEPINVDSGDKKTHGSHVVMGDDLGTYKLVFDNSYSYWRSKEIFFHISVVEMPEP